MTEFLHWHKTQLLSLSAEANERWPCHKGEAIQVLIETHHLVCIEMLTPLTTEKISNSARYQGSSTAAGEQWMISACSRGTLYYSSAVPILASRC